MKKNVIIGLILAAFLAVLTGAAFAQDTYSFELTEADQFAEEKENWSVSISVPQISGMADAEEQAELNDYFKFVKDEMVAEYQQNVEFAEESSEEGMTPHFTYQYSWDVVTDNENHFVFRTSWFLAAGSSTTLNEYWNLDKKTGKLLDFDEDVLTDSEQYSAIYEQIFAKMQESNESGEGTYWTEDDSLEIALSNIEYLNHWYYNNDGELVITFDKYEIAPGAMGCPEFVVTLEPAAAE